jgi:hypothetical protein
MEAGVDGVALARCKGRKPLIEKRFERAAAGCQHALAGGRQAHQRLTAI